MQTDLLVRIRDVVDFPKTGIVFKDLTPVIGDGVLFARVIRELVAPFREQAITAVVGMEARGFIFGSAAAYELQCGFVPLRKPGKLPYDTVKASYALEYGHATLEMHVDAVAPTDRVLLVDDLIATGGTARASCELVERVGASIIGCAFVVELAFLNGRDSLSPYQIHTLVKY